ncbi:hypothetical protein KJ763_00265 [Patescibacteria group bacterium]|nr:hypothetical protein [Patescibacteria group bacterium]
MKEYTQTQIIEMYEKLPEDLKEAIFSVESANVITVIGKKYGLNVEQIGKLGNETGLVMLGITSSRNYIDNLSKRLGISPESALKVANEVSSTIFSNVRESLKKIHGETSQTSDVFPSTSDVNAKEEILKEIEKSEVPEILKGVHKPSDSAFGAKTGEGIFRMPLEESVHEEEKEENKYPGADPYREPLQ